MMAKDSLYQSLEYLEYYRNSFSREVAKANRTSYFRISPKIKRFKQTVLLRNRLQPIEFLCVALPVFEKMAKETDVVRVLDVGGGGGDNYILVRRHLKPDIHLNWSIQDPTDLFRTTFDIRSRLKKSVIGKDVIFWEPELASFVSKKFDLVLLRGSIQYMTDREVENACEFTENALIVDRSLIMGHSLSFTHSTVIAGQTFHTHYSSRSFDDLTAIFKTRDLGIAFESIRFPYSLKSTSGVMSGHTSTLVFLKE